MPSLISPALNLHHLVSHSYSVASAKERDRDKLQLQFDTISV